MANSSPLLSRGGKAAPPLAEEMNPASLVRDGRSGGDKGTRLPPSASCLSVHFALSLRSVEHASRQCATPQLAISQIAYKQTSRRAEWRRDGAEGAHGTGKRTWRT